MRRVSFPDDCEDQTPMKPSVRARELRRRKIRMYLGSGAALLVVGALALAALAGGGHSAGSATQTGTTPDAATRAAAIRALTAVETRVPGDRLALGSVKAPVIMVIWSDFQCPYCGQFARTTEPVLIRKYVDTGKLRLEWRDFPYLGPQSTTAAQAARAAAAQGRFWQYHDALYAHQHPVNSGALTQSYLVALAGKLGLNTATFTADMTSTATAAAVQADLQQGTSLGVNGTPAFMVGTTPVSGAQPTAYFESVINAALAHAA